MFNLFINKLANWYSKQCATCKTTRIEAILNNYNEEISCPDCKKWIIISKILLKSITTYTRIKTEDLSDLSSDKQAMALINALFRSINKYGFSIMKSGIPLYVVFDITNRCNLKCIHCYSSEQNVELKTSDVYHIIDMLYENGAGIIDFGGGEPLLRNDIFKVLSYSKNAGLYTSISTNGVLLNGGCIKNLKTLNIDQVCISLDGAKPETHNHIRNKKGTYKKAINGIKNCVNSGLNTYVSTVFMQSNICELENLYDLLNSLGIQGWYVYDFIPAGHGQELQDEILDSEQRKQLFEKLNDFAVSSKISIKPYPYSVLINSTYETDIYFYKKYGKLAELFGGCLTARWTCHISSNGDLNPCYLLPHKLGNLKYETFEKIWFNKSNPILNDLRNRAFLKGNCGICGYRDVCGGCRARAFWTKDDYLESDSCWIK